MLSVEACVSFFVCLRDVTAAAKKHWIACGGWAPRVTMTRVIGYFLLV